MKRVKPYIYLLVFTRIPANVVASALPNRFREPGPDQFPGVDVDRTVKVTVFNDGPDGGTSDSLALRVQERWLAEQKR